jgi:RNA polymerase sigma-70 factor, ECF subfamily
MAPSSDRARFEAVVLPHLDAAYRLARWLAPSPADADDVVQEAVLSAYRNFKALRGSDARPWLLAIVRNCHWNAMRQRRGFVPLPEDGDEHGAALTADAADNPEAVALQADAGQTLLALIAALRPEYREVLVLRELEDMNYREIASVTELPIGTVMSRLARARGALRMQWLARQTGDRI